MDNVTDNLWVTRRQTQVQGPAWQKERAARIPNDPPVSDETDDDGYENDQTCDQRLAEAWEQANATNAVMHQQAQMKTYNLTQQLLKLTAKNHEEEMLNAHLLESAGRVTT